MTAGAVGAAGGQRVAIFGATSAIAAEVAHVYAGRGARLFLAGRNPEKLRALIAALGDAGAVAGSCEVDFTTPGAADAAVAAAVAALGGQLDVALIAHGVLGDQLESERDFAEAQRILDANFMSVVALLVPLGNHFEAASGGNIAVMSSVAGDRGRPRNYTYGAAKGALNIYLQGLRTRLWPRGVRVQTLKLGPVDTPMTTTTRRRGCSRPARPPPSASSPPSTPAAPKPTSHGSGARSWPSSATSPSASCNACPRCRDVSSLYRLERSEHCNCSPSPRAAGRGKGEGPPVASRRSCRRS